MPPGIYCLLRVSFKTGIFQNLSSALRFHSLIMLIELPNPEFYVIINLYYFDPERLYIVNTCFNSSFVLKFLCTLLGNLNLKVI